MLMGKQAIDDDCAQTPQMLAGLLEWPQATFASKIEITDQQAVVTREVDAGLETLSVDLPAVISTDLRLNEPRFTKLPDIMKAKRKPIENLSMNDLNVDIAPGLKILSTSPPPIRKAGIKVEIRRSIGVHTHRKRSSTMSKILIIAEHNGVGLNISTARCVACAKQIGAEIIDIAVFAENGDVVASSAAKLEAVNKVLVINNAANQHLIASSLEPQIAAISAAYSHILAPGTTFGRDFMPRVSAKLGVPQVTDIMGVEGDRVFTRPNYAGNAIVKVEVPEGIVVGTVRTGFI